MDDRYAKPEKRELMAYNLERHNRLRAQWHEYNSNWTGIGFDFTEYEAWLEEQAEHWQRCANAKYEPPRVAYSDQDIIDNLQAALNTAMQEIADLKRNLEGTSNDHP